MPSNMAMADTKFPAFTGKEKLPEKVQTILDYLGILRKRLNYALGNLDMSNFNPAGLKEFTDIVAKSVTADTGDFELLFADLLIANTALLNQLIANDIYVTNIVTQNLYARNGDIANLTVDKIRTNAIKPRRYLAGDTSEINYWEGREELLEWRTATTDGTQVTQHKNLDGDLLYWKDGVVGGSMTNEPATEAELTAPVMVYIYTELTKLSIRFKPVTMKNGQPTVAPLLDFGAGTRPDTDPLAGKMMMWKDVDCFIMRFYSGNGSETYAQIEFNDDGLVYINGNPVGGIGNFDALHIADTGFRVTVGNTTYNFQTPKDEQGRITGVNGEGKDRVITYGD
jgi:hypothetical protein